MERSTGLNANVIKMNHNTHMESKSNRINLFPEPESNGADKQGSFQPFRVYRKGGEDIENS